jgi:hypothetical protein
MVETPDANLSIGMRQLNGLYTQKYNRRHNKTGHLFEGRFKAILVQKDSYLLELCQYVVLNPVRAGAAEKPEAWRWSSYQATAGLQKEPDYLATDWILGLFNRKRTVAQGHYRKFVREGVSAGTPWGKVQGQVLLGGEGFAEKFKSLLEYKREVKEIPRSQRYVSRPSLDEIFSGQETKGERDVRINTAHISNGYTLKDIADYLEIHYTTVSRVIGKAVINKK